MRLEKPDCLIFDVDGVLLRSNETYQEIIRLIVEGEWRSAGRDADAPGYSAGLNAVFKTHGSFNDDYDIAWVLLNIALSGGDEKLSVALPSPGRLEEIISSCGRSCSEWLPKRFDVRRGLDEIREQGYKLFMGLDGEPGLWKLDRPELEADWRDLPLPTYIYTGRNFKEWGFAQHTLGWEDFPDERVVHSGTGIKKPSPRGLEFICEKFGHERPVFFGDTMSDKLSYDAFGRGIFAAVGGLLAGVEPNFKDVGEALERITGWRPARNKTAGL
jgi:phosphoglycolate phosphatase-like HAD superfamily hydrolase